MSRCSMVGGDGIVVSCIIVTPDTDLTPFIPTGCTPVISEDGNVGWTYRDGKFTPPVIAIQAPPQPPQITIEEAMAQIIELKAMIDRIAATK